MSATALPSEVDVLAGTLAWFKKPEHFTADYYLANEEGLPVCDHAVVGATCAIGGVEHTIWQLTQQAVDDIGGLRHQACRAVPASRHRKPVARLFIAVMSRLNSKTREMLPNITDGDDNPIQTIEQITFELDADDALDSVRDVVRAALRDARREERVAA